MMFGINAFNNAYDAACHVIMIYMENDTTVIDLCVVSWLFTRIEDLVWVYSNSVDYDHIYESFL